MKIYKRDNLMREDFIPFSRPYITESDIESVNEVLR